MSSACWSWLPSATTGGKPGVEFSHELDAVQAELVGPKRQHALHELGHVLRLARGGLSARERQQVADDARGAPGLLGNAPKVESDFLGRPRGIARTQLALEQLREADDARQRVVQLVRDAGHQLTDRRELLGLKQLRLRRLQPLDRRRQLRVGLAQLVAHVPQPARGANLFGDVLRHLHDRRARRARIDGRERRDAENLLVRQRDLGALGAGE